MGDKYQKGNFPIYIVKIIGYNTSLDLWTTKYDTTYQYVVSSSTTFPFMQFNRLCFSQNKAKKVIFKYTTIDLTTSRFGITYYYLSVPKLYVSYVWKNEKANEELP